MKGNVLPALVILLIAFSALLQVDFIFYIAYVCALLFAFSRWHTPRALRNLKVSREFAPNAFLGERVDIGVTVSNPGRLPISWLQLRDVTGPQLRSGSELNTVLQIAGNASERLEYSVRAMRRGYYRVGPLQLVSGDLLGFREERASFAANYLTVYPRIVALHKLSLPSRLPFGSLPSSKQLFADPARPVGVRPFRSGDSLRQINWKVSGRQAATAGGGLMAKTVEPAISLDAFILLNLDRDAYSKRDFYDASEWAIEVAASLAAALTAQRQSVGLATNGHDALLSDDAQFDEETGRMLSDGGPSELVGETTPYNMLLPRRGRQHLMKMLGLLARVEGRATRQYFTEMISRATIDLNWGTTVIVITPSSDAQIVAALHRLVRRGYSPLLLSIAGKVDDHEERERARRLGFRQLPLRNELELKRAFGR